MTDKFMKIGGTDGMNAKAFTTDNKGNQNVGLAVRNELVAYDTKTVESKKTNAIISRFDELEKYSAIVVGVHVDDSELDEDIAIRVIEHWYVQKNGERYGLQVFQDNLLSIDEPYDSSDYIEIKGTQLSVVIANAGDEDVEVTVFVMGIR